MKWKSWTAAVFASIVLMFSSLALFSHVVAEPNDPAPPGGQHGGKGGGGGKGGQPGGGGGGGGGGRQAGGGPNRGGGGGGRQTGGGPNRGGGGGGGRAASGGAERGPPSQGGNRQGGAGRGAIHAPPSAPPRRAPPRGEQPAHVNRTPTFTNPHAVAGRGNAPRPPVTVYRPAGTGHNQGNRGFPGADPHGPPRFGVDPRHSGGNRASIVNRPFNGNTLHYNNHPLPIAHSGYQPAYYRHPGYHGYWNGNRGIGGFNGLAYGRAVRPGIGYGFYNGMGGGFGPGWGWGLGAGYGRGYGYGGYGYRPFGWGLGGWGLGALIYNSGYLGYVNPYYGGISPGIYNYAQPIPVAYNSALAVPADGVVSADETLTQAVAAFQQNDFDQALDIADKGIAQYPDDAVLHEFRALVLFAKHDYQQAAATIHSVLAVGPGWDWTTLSGMYTSVAVYTEQLEALQAFAQSNPKDAASRFLLAYHYMSCGHPDAAANHLQQVVQLRPDDRVAADLLRMVSAPSLPAADPSTDGPSTDGPSPQPPDESQRPAGPAINPASLVGVWKAQRADGSKFNLTLADATNFTWSFAQKDQPAQAFGGTYTVEGNVLALERKDGGALVAEVTASDAKKFNFKLLGAPDDDPGLDFSK